MSNNIAAQTTSLVRRFAEKANCDVHKYNTALETALGVKRQETILAALTLCEELELDPLRGDVYIPVVNGNDGKPSISYQGWTKIVTSRPDFNGVSTEFSENKVKIEGLNSPVPEYVQVTMWRKGIDHPTVIREYIEETFQSRSLPWRKFPRRMLRHKGFIQAARLTFALRGDGEDVDYGNIDAAQVTLNAVDADGVIKTPVQTSAPAQVAPQPAAFMRFKTEAEMLNRVGVLISAVKEGRSTKEKAVKMLTQRVHPSQLDQCLTILEKGLEPQPLAQAPQELAPETEESVVSQVLSPEQNFDSAPQVMSPQEGAAPAVLTADDEIPF